MSSSNASTNRRIRIADATIINPGGYGQAILPTTEEDLRFEEVWYVPKFDTDLVSVNALHDKGIEVISQALSLTA